MTGKTKTKTKDGNGQVLIYRWIGVDGHGCSEMSRNIESNPKLFRVTGTERVRDAEKQSKSVDIQNAPITNRKTKNPAFRVSSQVKKRKRRDCGSQNEKRAMMRRYDIT